VKRFTRNTLGLCALLASTLLASGCRHNGSADSAAAGHPVRALPKRVEVKEVEDRPPISLVARLGDPSAAVAVALAHDLGSPASAGLAALLEARVRTLGFATAESRPHQLGLQLHSLVDSPDAAAAFIKACTTALATPVVEPSRELEAARQTVEALRSRTWGSRAEAAVAGCSGELGIAPETPHPETVTVAVVESWRKAVYSTQTAAFAALGAAPVLEAATEALEATPAWPEGAAVTDVWPSHGYVGVDATDEPERRLSVALRVADGNAAIHAADSLAAPASVLRARLTSLRPSWQLARSVATTRPRGACLRLDLRTPANDAPPARADVADVAQLATEEMRLALSQGNDDGWTLEQSVLRPIDPREAAAVAAWRTLSGRHEAGSIRRFVSYTVQSPKGEERSFADAVRLAEQKWKEPTLERRARVEPGQGELWALLASPCGSSAETESSAGQAALLVRTVAERSPQVDGVAIEPWVTPDGIGLLAHGAPADAYEPPTAHANRIGSALGRAILGARLGGSQVAQTRARLVEELGPGPRPGWWLALESLAPDRPSWLEPRGTWEALTDLTTQAVERQRQAFVDGPLRLAVIANWSDEQPAAVVEGLQRWLRPHRASQRQCAAVTRGRARSGRYDLQTTGTEAGPAAYVGVPLPSSKTDYRREAEWTTLLLNRESGWLDQALVQPGLVSSAHAQLVGGRRSAALIIEIRALDEGMDKALAQVRALLDRLARGAATQEDADLARAHFARLDRLVGLDPRYRIVHLWHGRPARSSADLASLRRFHQLALRAESHVMVVVTQRP